MTRGKDPPNLQLYTTDLIYIFLQFIEGLIITTTGYIDIKLSDHKFLSQIMVCVRY